MPVILAPAALVAGCLTLLAAAPLLLILRLIAPVLPARPRCAARLVLLLGAYLLTFELGALAFALRRRPHQAEAVFGRLTSRFFTTGFRVAGMRLHPDRPVPALPADRPMIIISRHAGFLNFQLSVFQAISVLGRSPRAICKLAVTADPGMAVLLRDLRIVPFRWNRHGRICALRRLITMARQAGPGDALIIYPEGTNITARRRHKALSDNADASRYQDLRHMQPPQMAGTLKLLQYAPDADVLIFGHTGMEDLLSAAVDLGYPPLADGVVRTAFWHVPAAEVPRDRAAVEAWLAGWWRTLDQWVATVRAPGQPRPHEYATAGAHPNDHEGFHPHFGG